MRITILTQSDPFFLAENVNYLVKNLPVDCQIVSTVLFDVSPFGKRETFLQKANKTISIFGYRFFLNYGFKFLINRINPNKSVKKILQKHNIPIIELENGINHSNSLDIIKSYKPDLLISIAGNQIFKKPLLELAPTEV
jgi:methionyl-tRNA formyltransferase